MVSMGNKAQYEARTVTTWAYIGNVEAEKMGNSSSRDFELDVILQASSCIRGSINVFEFLGGFHILDSQPMLVDESLTNKALSGSTI